MKVRIEWKIKVKETNEYLWDERRKEVRDKDKKTEGGDEI
jgi:hypothetical protein